ncbi:hypothetical protein A3A79_02195 [Candidatus Gottesmanbacteria bacterium RIFCSPLOWO2_01_FULL_43_11b]|uniref:HMA domain-containing protein n=1 Tax=Candidatus Gottesmanbacteria bacterium RIFCSPLOWO2_01_FULL_43_11b TaxID=1798392 RepID=A0A1F6AI85_9BACT|nr:MAG: hypothetical protein A3A79_02195 [Candidatus Gottesmanbacteria bacterium RIFCSPLOWO2_01_FULL_43_11b]
MTKKTLKLNGLHCTSCAMLIEGELEDIGAKAACNWVKQVVTLEYDEKSIHDNDIKNAIARAGYSVIE